MAPSPDPAEPPKRYHGAAIALHWLLAALLMFQFALGLRLDTIAAGGAKFTAFQFHKSIGIAVLLLSCARLGLWLLLPRPAEVGPSGQRLAARAAHWAFYAIMIFAPLSGWIIVSTAKLRVPTVLFGLAAFAAARRVQPARDAGTHGAVLVIARADRAACCGGDLSPAQAR